MKCSALPIIFFSVIAMGFGSPLHAQSGDEDAMEASEDTTADPGGEATGELKARPDLPDFHTRTNEFSLLKDPHERRSYFWKPLVSFVLPGFGQWTEGKYGWGSAYTGGALFSIGYAISNVPDQQKSYESDAHFANRVSEGITERKFAYGMQWYQSLGGLSAYHTFRQSVRANQRHGKFLFLTEEERIADIMLAPFQFQFLTRKSTYIPLAIGAAINVLIFTYAPHDKKTERDGLSAADVFFASGFSYNAGTHEEALFRGWVLPMFMEATGSKTWSNIWTAGVFALAHLNTISVPLPQFILGWHLGNVTIANNWTVAESIFIHTWWDVLAFITSYQIRQKENGSAALGVGGMRSGFRSQEPSLHLPPITFYF